MSVEKRNLVIVGAELRAMPDYILQGKALSYNTLSPDNQLGPGMREKIAPGCFAESLRNGGYQGDVRFLVNHNPDRVLGRLRNGTLKLQDSADALRFTVQLDSRNSDHTNVWAQCSRGDLSECSFAFCNVSDSWMDDQDSKGQPCKTRVIRKADIIDCSLVTYPFYSDAGSTSATARDAFGHGPSTADSIDRFRRLTRAYVSELVRTNVIKRSEMDQTDFACLEGNYRVAHELAEAACAIFGTCDDIMGDWMGDAYSDDDDRSRRTRRGSQDLYPYNSDDANHNSHARCHKETKVAISGAAESFARCRMSFAKLMAAKKK